MAARVKKIRHDDETRSRIQAAKLMDRLHACVMGEIELSATQVAAAKTLLGKILPDLQAVDMQSTTDNTVRILAEKPMTSEEWAKSHAATHSVGTPAGASTRTH